MPRCKLKRRVEQSASQESGGDLQFAVHAGDLAWRRRFASSLRASARACSLAAAGSLSPSSKSRGSRGQAYRDRSGIAAGGVA